MTSIDDGMGPEAPADLEVLRGELRDLASRVDQVRSALERDSRALDDRTLAQMLDTVAAWRCLARDDPQT